MRLIIGDRNPIEQAKYLKFTLGRSTFEISNKENRDIATKAIKITKDWREKEYVLSSQEIYNSPIYLILFVIARETEKDAYTDTRPFLNRFQEIVAHDYSIIEEFYPGLGITLYYWAHIRQEYRVYISWKAFLTIADSYARSSSKCKQLTTFDDNNPIIKIFSHYVSLKEFANPDFANIRYFIFHHDVLIEDGLKAVKLRGWHPFEKSFAYQFAEVMWEAQERNSAVDLIEYLFDEEIGRAVKNEDGRLFVETQFLNPEIKQVLANDEHNYWGFFGLLFVDRFIQTYYENANKNKEEQYWINSIYYFLWELDCISYHSRLIVLKKIIDLGCMSQVVHNVHSWLLNGQTKDIIDFFKTVKVHPFQYRRDKDGRFFFGWIERKPPADSN